MKDYTELTAGGQVRRIRRLAQAALAEYPLRPVRLWPLHHGHNTTFGVEAVAASGPTRRYVLRASQPGWRLLPHLEAEIAFLLMLRAESDLVVPKPVATRGGALFTTAEVPGVPGPRQLVLFEWVEGQFFRRRLSATRLRRVGRFTADLHNFTTTHHARLAELPRPSVQWEHRAGHDGDMARVMAQAFERGGSLLPPARRALFLAARTRIEQTMDALGWEPDRHGLLHADLHMGNLLYHRGTIRAIDFDDLGWGHYLYDVAVTQWYFRWRPDFEELRVAQLQGYRERRALSVAEEGLLPAFRSARTLMMACYIASRRDHPRFRRWAAQFVQECTSEIERFLDGSRGALQGGQRR